MGRMWLKDVGQPLEWQQCPDNHLPVPEHQGRQAHAAFQHNKMQGRQCGRQGEVRTTLQYSPLFSLLFFLIENAV